MLSKKRFIAGFHGHIKFTAIAGDLSSNDNTGQNVDANLLYDADGGVRKFTENAGSGSTADAGAWASNHPNFANGANWSVRVTHQTGTNRYTTGSGLGTWLSLDTNRNWNFDWQPGGGPAGPDVSTYLVEISDDGGTTTYDSATLTVTLTVNSP